MKAKHFKRLRQSCQWYYVESTSGLFGDFGSRYSYGIRVLAKNPRQACKRAKKRGYGLDYNIGEGTEERWARWKVRLFSKSDHFRNVSYF